MLSLWRAYSFEEGKGRNASPIEERQLQADQIRGILLGNRC